MQFLGLAAGEFRNMECCRTIALLTLHDTLVSDQTDEPRPHRLILAVGQLRVNQVMNCGLYVQVRICKLLGISSEHRLRFRVNPECIAAHSHYCYD
jgi:hypothetical protein